MTPTRLGTFDYDAAGDFVQGPAGDKNRGGGRITGEAATPIFVWGSHARLLPGTIWERDFSVNPSVWVQVDPGPVRVDPGSEYDNPANFALDLDILGSAMQSHNTADYAAVGRNKPRYVVVLIQAHFNRWLGSAGGFPGPPVIVEASVTSGSQWAIGGIPPSAGGIPVISISVQVPMRPATFEEVGPLPGGGFFPIDGDDFGFTPGFPPIIGTWPRFDAFLAAFARALGVIGPPESQWLQNQPANYPHFVIHQAYSHGLSLGVGIADHPVAVYSGEAVRATTPSPQGAFDTAKRDTFVAFIQERLSHTLEAVGGELRINAGTVYNRGRWVRAVAGVVRANLP